jgi:hypothetical protein
LLWTHCWQASLSAGNDPQIGTRIYNNRNSLAVSEQLSQFFVERPSFAPERTKSQDYKSLEKETLTMYLQAIRRPINLLQK